MKKFFMLLFVMILAFIMFAEDFVVADWLTPEKPKMGGEVNLALSGAPDSFNLYGTFFTPAFSVMVHVLNPLIDLQAVYQQPEPALAESWDISEDGKEVIFHLRDVKWSDGHPFSADDVMFTLKYFAMNEKAINNAIPRLTIGGELVKWEKIDDMTVKAILPEPFGPFLMTLSHVKIFPEHVLEPLIDKNDLSSVNFIWTTNTPVNQIVGTGPFMIEQYVTDQKVVLKKNPNYWKVDKWGNRLPYIERINFIVIPDAEVTMAKFMTGEVDFAVLDPKDYPTLKSKELSGAPFTIFAAEPVNPTPSPFHITFNLDEKDPELRKLFREDDFRRAIEYALDRDRIIEEVYNTLAVYGGTPTLPSNFFYNPKIEEIRRPYDLDKASELLDKLGLKDTDKDGIRNLPSGKNFEVVFLTTTAQQAQEIAYIFSEDVKKIGIKLHLQFLDTSVIMETLLAGNFEMSMYAFGNQPDPQLRKEIWQPSGPLYYNHISTKDPKTGKPVFENMLDWELEVYELFEKGQTTMDPQERKKYYDRWQEIYADKVPYIFVCKPMDIWGWNKRIGNVYQLNGNGPVVYSYQTIFVK